MTKRFSQKYSPQYFLAALGNGGLAVSFFMYLMFMVKHPDTPIPTFSHISGVLTSGDVVSSVLVLSALALILFFVARHFLFLVLNVRAYFKYKKSSDYEKLRNSNSEVILFAMPLTYAMSVNVLFIVGALYIPGLWSIVENIFPFALAAFGVIGIYALKIASHYYSRLIINGGFEPKENNNLGQLISSFAFAMIAVGFAAPAAMSGNIYVSTIGLIGSVFFGTISALLLVLKLVIGLKSIFQNGMSDETVPSLWIIIPIMTLFGITFVRLVSGVFHNLLELTPPPVLFLVALIFLASMQGVTGLIGYTVMKKKNYFKDYVNGNKISVGSYSLICPGVAAFVLGMFLLNKGIVKSGIIDMFSAGYFAILIPLALVQIVTIVTLFKLDKKHVCRGNCEEIANKYVAAM